MNGADDTKDFTEFALDTPLSPGVYVLEASAGTGKTYQITSLFLRLIGEKDIEVEKILAMTFTVAATAEMKDRVRKRLQKAVSMLRDASTLGVLSPDVDDELLRVMLQKVRNTQKLSQNFLRALADLDKAQVFTIHGFCYRMLESFAFEVGLEFDAELIEDASEIVREALGELFVQKMENLGKAEQWLVEPCAREKLFERVFACMRRLSEDPDARLLPEKIKLCEPPDIEEWNELFQEAQHLWQRSRDEIVHSLENAIAREILNKKMWSEKELDKRKKLLDQYFSRSRNPCNTDWRKTLEYFSTEDISSATRQGKTAPSHPFFNTISRVTKLALEFEEWYARWKRNFLHEGFERLLKEVRRKKLEKRVMTFHDLLVLLRDAIKDKDRGELVKKAIQKKYRAVLVDEFQDTDVVQWEIFRELFRTPEHYLFLVGDPKQSIYAFRKADVFAYLQAQWIAQKRYTIGVNWRSDEALVKAINHLYLRQTNPFYLGEIQYHEVKYAERNKGSRVKDVPDFMAFPLTFRVKKKRENLGETGDEDLQRFVLTILASDIVKLLNSDAMVCEDGLWRRVQPKDIAVLVRTNLQGRKVKMALGRRGVPSVIFGQDSVFAGDAAKYLSYVLRGVLNPGQTDFLKTALASPFFGKTAEEVLRLSEDDLADYTKMFTELRDLWAKQGIASMLSQMMARCSVLQNIVQCEDGERLATDLRHLMELLQHQESEFEMGIDGLFSWFAQKVADAKEGSPKAEEEEVRLESDEDAVNVVTMHKAKGLEYGFVFCPFLWEGVNLHAQEKVLRFHSQEADGQYVLNFALRDFLGKDEKELFVELAETEEFQERLRIAYVALTRAKFRCVVYAMAQPTKNGTRKSPLWWILSGTGAPTNKVIGEEEVQKAIEEVALSSGGTIGVTEIEKEVGLKRYSRGHDKEPVELDCKRFSGRGLMPFLRTSFSGLVGFGKRNEEPAEIEPKTFVEPAVEGEPPILLPTFPDGAIPGQCIHEIFRQVSFRAFPSSEQMRIVHGTLQRWRFSTYAPEVQKMLEVVLRYPLDPKTGLTLDRVEDHERFCEIGFVVPAFRRGNINPQAIKEILTAEGSDVEREYAKQLDGLHFPDFQGILVGQMDLVFRHHGKWYLVDYKTNKLGQTLGDYAQNRLLEVMIRDHYVLQYLLYYTALHRYLRYRVKDYDPERDLGVVYYLFVRGMKEGGGDSGVFATKPPVGLVEGLSTLFGTPDKGR